MFNNLTDRLSRTLKNISGKGRLTEENIKSSLREVRMALLEADVALEVVRNFIKKVKEKAVGLEVSKSLSPGQEFIKIVQKELEEVMGESNESLNLSTQPPAVILMAGLQGAGKTTTAAKLAAFIEKNDKKKVLLVSTDVYRPAAIKQLETLANEIKVDFFSSNINESPIDITQKAIKQAKLKFYDVLIIDTAGRLHVDEDMMSEISLIHKESNPIETLFVVDSMTGQDAANTAKAFNDLLPLSGVILTKIDGDTRGGAALSVKEITGKPIKFLGVSEKINGLEPFYPDRIASRILGMGDVLSLIEDIEKNVDKDKASKLAKKIKSKKSFDLDDFVEQLGQMKKMGGMTGMLSKLPGAANLPDHVKDQVDDNTFIKMEVIISSMTKKERQKPEIIKGSRKKRIAVGSGTSVQDVNKLLKQFTQMQKMMKKMQTGGIRNMMKSMKGMMPNNKFQGF
ncbi:signal recognition particle protein [Paraphotobacterium marinum]|uniref:Signal recognition particle protein n=1 Tax=Paraphotobacterium marinum TaxID=1755811 RepID=A0A220VBS8_9GAMM|nr:signal recognition particle protein [Paraphotobacterium marinum]ASK77848.1 signal recognition particle protein [Paraphotobacterium marinum]